MIVFSNNKVFLETEFSIEAEYEKEIFSQSALFFGKNSILIDTKKKIRSEHLGDSIPDGFLFDLSDKKNPEFYLVEVELKKHDFYKHIFPQITKFFAFFRNTDKQKELVEKLFSAINTEETLKKQFKRYLGEKEIFKFLTDTINSSQNILIIIDGAKKEFPEIIDTYADTWGKMVKILEIVRFANESDIIFTMSPEFEAIQYSTPTEAETETVTITEDFHLEGLDENLKNLYFEIKGRVSQKIPDAVFNPQKYYISIKSPRNMAYIKFRKRRIEIILMIPLEEIKERIQKNQIKELSQGVQNFYNGPCGSVEIRTAESIDEIIEAIEYTYEYNKPSENSA
jgi:predicted transport protein